MAWAARAPTWLRSWHWPSSALGRQQPYVGRGAVCVALRPPGPGLPGPVTAYFPCLSGRPASGRGGWKLQSLCSAPVHPPQLSTLDLPLGVDPGAGPQCIRVHYASLPRSGLGPQRSPGGWGPALLLGCGRVARGVHGLCGPGAGGRGPGASALSAQRPELCRGRREATANLYTKCF